MTRAEFERVAQQAELAARQNPSVYRLRVALLAALGYGFVWFLLLGAVGLLALLAAAILYADLGAVTFRLGELAIPAVIFIGITAKALWIRIDPPQGVPLGKAEFPELFDALAFLRRKLRGPRIHAVLLDDQFNAAISQVPRLGVFGWYRNYLILGLPLLQALSRQQATAVLAHEYGHLSGAHGRFGAWIYRIRKSWYQLMVALEARRSAAGALLSAFFEWYAPYFDAYSFALARTNEYQADRAAASTVGASHLAAALIRLETAGRTLEREFWPGVYRLADESPAPAVTPFARLAEPAALEVREEHARELLTEALGAPTSMADTHPALADRLRPLAVTPAVPTTPTETAAEVFLGERLEQLVRGFDERWQSSCAAAWSERHEMVQRARARLAELGAAEEADRSVDALLEQAHLTEQLGGAEAALAFYQRIVAREPRHPFARYRVALASLAAGDETAVAEIEAAMTDDVGLQIDGCLTLRDYFAARTDMERADAYHERAVAASHRHDRIQEERSTFPFENVYDPPDLDAESRARLVECLRGDDFVKHAYVVRKRLMLSETPVYVVGVIGGPRVTLGDDRAAVSQRIASRLTLPLDIVVVVLEGNNKKFLRVLQKVQDSKLF